ncbi:MAG TPA: MFS transporter [Polyangiaceae bacterium]|nr:MFS transporter [Polyangiaceae bacterium]
MVRPDCSSEESAGDPAPDALLTPAFVRVMGAQLAIGFGFSIYFLLPKYLATALHAGPTTIGTVMSTSLAAAVATTPMMGALLDRYGRRIPMALSALVVVVASLGMLRVREVGALLYALRLLQGVGFALGFNAAAALVADIAPLGRLGQAMGLLGTASLITNAIAPALFEGVAARWGWAPVFAAASFTGLVTLAVTFSLPRPRANDVTFSAGTATATPTLTTSRINAATLATGAAFGTLISFTQPFALARGAERVSTYLVGYTLGALVVRIALGSLADRVGRQRVAQWSLFAYGAVALLTSLLEPSLLLPLGILFGAAHGFLYPALAALAADGASPERRGRTLANFNAAFNSGAGLAMLGGGWVAHAGGYPALFGLVGLITLTSVLSLSASPAKLLLPPESKP